MNRIQWTTFFAGSLLALSANLLGGDVANQAFTIQYDESGIRSLKRTNDAHDTEYLAANGILGSLVIRYRSTPNGDWRELRDLLPVDAPSGGQTIRYKMAASLPTLAAKSTASAAVGVGGLRSLNDGQYPRPAGRGSGPAGGGLGRPGAATAPTPAFTWSAARGEFQWVQYTFPTEEEISRSEVFWVADADGSGRTVLPESWRILYQEGREWKEVQKKAPYTLQANAFNIVEFAPVRTLALRVEAKMAPNATVGIAEWRVGPEKVLVPPGDLAVEQTFNLNGERLDWTVTIANSGAKPIEIGDLAVPFNFAERIGQPKDLYIRKLIRHALVAGHGSWIYWQRSGGEGPYRGYWNPSKENDGATGGGFVPDAMGRGWIGKQMPRGAWYYSAEEDVGYCGALRTHATILARDPIFGEIAYGGVMTRQGKSVSVVPRDGLRVRLHVIRDNQRLHMILDHDGYAKEQPIVIADDLSRIEFTLENRAGRAHETGLAIAGLPAGDYAVLVGKRNVKTIHGGPQEQKIELPVGGAFTQVSLARTGG